MLHFIAETQFDAPPVRVQEALLDYEGHRGYVERLSVSRILERRPETLVVYQRLDMPVIDDRDYTLQVRWGRRDADLWVSFRALRSGPAPREGAVWIYHHRGGWRLEPIRGGEATRARYETQMDLGGWVPMWMARSSAGHEVAQVIAQFSRMVADRKPPASSKGVGRFDHAIPPAHRVPPRAGSR